MLIALTRSVSPAFADCELTHVDRQRIDVTLAAAQHTAYEAQLAALGCAVRRLPAAPDLPDSVFVEDTALVFDEVAVITRPGAPSRRPEVYVVAEALKAYRPLREITAPGTLDGGDVLTLGHAVYVGLSRRTNAAGVDQLRAILTPFGYTVHAIPLTACLHLKSAVTQVADDALLLNPQWVDPASFNGWRLIEVAPDEPHAANALLVGGRVIFPAAHQRTAERLTQASIVIAPVDVSEIAKAEGGVTCCSLIFKE